MDRGYEGVKENTETGDDRSDFDRQHIRENVASTSLNLQEARKALDELEKVLEPILRPERDTEMLSEGDVPMPLQSPLAVRVAECRDGAWRLTTHVRDLLSRVDL